jgi:hypothetical protein
MTVRLDPRTQTRLRAVAKRRRLTPSAATRLALETWLDGEEASPESSPYELVQDLVGSTRGGDARRSSRSTRALVERLRRRHRRFR